MHPWYHIKLNAKLIHAIALTSCHVHADRVDGVVSTRRCLVLVHADGILGLVEQALVAGRLVGVLLAGDLVLEGLAGGLLAVGNGITR